MPVIIQDLDAVVVDEPDTPAGATSSGSTAEAAAPPPRPALQAWLSLRDLAAERETRLAID